MARLSQLSILLTAALATLASAATPYLDAEVRSFLETDSSVVKRSFVPGINKPLARRAAEGRRSRHLRLESDLVKRQDLGYEVDFGDGTPQPVRGSNGGTHLSPSNPELDRQNPDGLAGPPTDSGLVPNLKWSFSLSHTRILPAGWVREQLIQDLPPSKDFAGAEIRLGPNAYRELHWHRVSEWGLILGGSGRIVAVDEKGRNYAADINGPKDGQDPDIYVFPPGVPHSIQAFDDGLEILLLFSDGDFEKSGTTFHLSDWLVHTPPEVLAQNFGVNASVFGKLPAKNPYIFNSTKPPPQEGHSSDLDQRPESPDGIIPTDYVFRLKDQKPHNALGGGGYVKIQSADTNFPPSEYFATAYVHIEPAGLREMHWHINDEWLYIVSGTARATVYMGGANARTFDLQAGDTAVFPAGSGHYLQNTSKQNKFIYIEVFKSKSFIEYTALQWAALMPRQAVADLLNVTVDVVKTFKSEKQTLIAGK